MTSDPETQRAAGIPVFICYRRREEDIEVADRLFTLLAERGIEAWYDRLIPEGQDWRDSIVENLSRARIMVILLSEAALESDELKKELAVASQYDVQLVGVRIEDVMPREAFAYELSGIQWFDLLDRDAEQFAELVDRLQAQLERPNDVSRQLGAKALRPRRRRGRLARLLRNGPLLFGGFLAVTAVQFFLYDRITASAGETPFLYKLAAVSLFSPLLMLQALTGDIEWKIPIVITTTLHSALLIAIVWFLIRTLRNRLLRWRAARRSFVGRGS